MLIPIFYFLLLSSTFQSGSRPEISDQMCASCHPQETASFGSTAMGESMSPPGAGEAHEGLSERIEFFSPEVDRHYAVFEDAGRFFPEEIVRGSQGEIVYRDTREVDYSVGAGINGWSYLVKSGERLYMSPISYYAREGKWGLSPAYAEGDFEGFSRPITMECLACHAGRPRPQPDAVNSYQNPVFSPLAIGCARCHGEGAEHVRFLSEGEVDKARDAIINPADLSSDLADQVCFQCHLRGDARVNQPGKGPMDFQPGRPLSEVVKVFTVPLQAGTDVFPGVSHAEQMRSSQCWEGSGGQLACITCHNPHDFPAAAQSAEYFRQRCLTCHELSGCQEEQEMRAATSPPDSCVACHMPKTSLFGIPHSVATDHRILRRSQESIEMELLEAAPGEPLKTIGFELSDSDLRTRALAYAQVSANFPQYRREGYQLLREAQQRYPDDLSVQESFGLIQVQVSEDPRSMLRAARALQRAVELGSLSGRVYYTLAQIRLGAGQQQAALGLLEKAVELEPHFTPPARQLAQIYLEQGEKEQAVSLAQRVLKFVPSDQFLRDIVEPQSPEGR